MEYFTGYYSIRSIIVSQFMHMNKSPYHIPACTHLEFVVIALSLFIVTPIHCQYFITANNDSYCLSIGTHSLTNNPQVFWCTISHSSNCINWSFEKHFNQETQPIYNGKLFVNGIGAHAINQATYLNQRMYVDDTDFSFTQAQSQLPTSQTYQSVAYDSTNNIIELVGGAPDGTLHVEYSIDSHNFTNLGQPFDYYHRAFGQSYTTIGDTLYSGYPKDFDVVNELYTSA
eukprot:256759_1